MHLPDFQYLAPKNSNELTSMLSKHGEHARILSGGTDLLVQMKEHALTPQVVIDINGLGSLLEITYDDRSGLTIGGAAKLEAIMEMPMVKEKYYSLWQSIKTIGARQIRTMGSLGGNLCNASPAADTPSPLISFGAQVTIANAKKEKTLLLEEFILGNRKTVLACDEYLKSIFLGVPAFNSGSSYQHFRVRGGMEIAMVAVAVYLDVDPRTKTVTDSKIVLGVVGPTPIRATKAEQIVAGQKPSEKLLQCAGEACTAHSEPIDDFRGSANYRREILRVLFERAFEESYSRAIGAT